MFNNSSIFLLSEEGSESHIYRLETDADAQRAINGMLSTASQKLIQDKERIPFDGNYKPNADEYLAIERFCVPEEIRQAVRDPLGVEPFRRGEEAFPPIKMLFVGDCEKSEDSVRFHFAFQRFRKEQYLSANQINLFLDKNTFIRQRNFGLGITDTVDCLYTDEALCFSSFYYARQVFDLRNYYREATDTELASFSDNPGLVLEDKDVFMKSADSWIRRKISLIQDSGVLETHKPAELVERAEEIGLHLTTKEDKLVLPKDKKQVKVILGFLDEEAYKGIFSGTTYLANSKRKLGGK